MVVVDPQVMAALAPSPAGEFPFKTTTTVVPVPVPSFHPGPVYDAAGDAGKRTLWVVFVIMLLSSVVFTALSWRVPVTKRIYHVITTLIVTIAALSYFAMATGQGISYHTPGGGNHHHGKHGAHDDKWTAPVHEHVARQVYWARYVDWALTTPLLLLDLSLIAGLNGADILTTIVADVIMVLTGLFAAFGDEHTPQKWGWYAIGCVAYLVVVYQLGTAGRRNALARGGKVGGFFASIAGFTLILWTAYPIVWGITDGARKVDVDGEIIAYAILDVLAKPVFGLWLLLTHINLPETNVELSGFWSTGFAREGAIRVGEDEEGA